MRVVKVLMSLWALFMVLVAAVTVVAVTSRTPSLTDSDVPLRNDVVGDVGQLDMLESDQQMLERMRRSLTPGMNTMIGNDPMWTDPAMIRAQEEYQAQLDRMIAKRPGTP